MKNLRHTLVALGALVSFIGFTGHANSAEWKPISPAELSIDMDLTFFEIKGAQELTEGSFVGQAIQFTGGYFARYVYHRGYVVEPSDNSVRKGAKAIFKDIDTDALEVNVKTIPVGTIRYTMVAGPKLTCMYFEGGAGRSEISRGKRIREITMEGLYCEQGQVSDLEETALDQFGKIKLK